MKKAISAIAAALLLATPLVSFAQTAAAASPAPYSVFVDQPTGFTFVKLPSGWKFVGAVSKEDARHVPASVLTSVLPGDAGRAVETASK